MSDQVTHVFVYGTLRQGAANHDWFCGDALTIEPGSTTGRLYDLPAGFPAMIDDDGGAIYGEAMTFPDLEATLVRLDRLEVHRPGHPEHSLYVRCVRQITLLGSGETVLAYCYVWRGNLPEGAVLVRSGRWHTADI